MIKKITSRKFALAIVMIIVMLIVADNKDVACVCATAIAMVYMLAEAIVDKARAVKRSMNDDITVTKCVCNGEQENEDK